MVITWNISASVIESMYVLVGFMGHLGRRDYAHIYIYCLAVDIRGVFTNVALLQMI